MNLRKCLLTHNDCCIRGRTIVPKGVMVHSTGCNTPELRRYVAPNDGLLGEPSPRHWNQSGVGACGSACCVYALRILSRTGQDPAALLGVILAFFGGELGLMFWRDALKGKQSRDGSLSDAVPGDVSDSDTEL